MKRPKLAVLPYRHSKTHRYYLDLRAFGQGRKFFKTKAEGDAERLRQIALRKRGGRETVGLHLNELSSIAEARRKLGKYGKSITDAAEYYLDYLERVQRCNITVSELATEVEAAKRKDGRSPIYLNDLRNRLAVFSADFGSRPIASITVEE